MALRFLHLSDIHFGQEKAGELVTNEFIRDALIKDVKSLADLRGPASRILVTGDISYSGKALQYGQATKWLEKLTAAGGVGEIQVSTIPGNHDCDLNRVSNQAKMVQAKFRSNNVDQLRADLHGIYEDGEEASPFLPKLQGYREFARGYGCDFESHRRPLWIRYFDLAPGIRLKLIGLTSVQVSDLNDRPGNIFLGNVQYMIGEEENVVNVVLIHHPLDWFIDKAEAKQHLHNHARVILVGHEHLLDIQKTTDAFTKKEWLVIYAGATTPPETGYSFQYNWLEFSFAAIDGKAQLNVDVFPRVWISQAVKFDADRARLGSVGDSIRIEIQCSNVRPLDDPKPADEIPRGPIVEHPSIHQSPSAPSSESSRAEISSRSAMKNDSEFDRLRYLFWRYLDWRQRLQVLVQVDALPKSSDQPLPQTMERIALEAASKSSGKLYEIWEAMMPLIPSEKRTPNPFERDK